MKYPPHDPECHCSICEDDRRDEKFRKQMVPLEDKIKRLREALSREQAKNFQYEAEQAEPGMMLAEIELLRKERNARQEAWEVAEAGRINERAEVKRLRSAIAAEAARGASDA